MSGTVDTNNDGVRLHVARHQAGWQFRWSELVKIAAWKVDVFTTDLVCLGFMVEGSDANLCCNEAQSGWDLLNVQLNSRYAVKLEEWFYLFAFRAFTENFTLLWER